MSREIPFVTRFLAISSLPFLLTVYNALSVLLIIYIKERESQYLPSCISSLFPLCLCAKLIFWVFLHGGAASPAWREPLIRTSRAPRFIAAHETLS
jgi:hypothetical protein